MRPFLRKRKFVVETIGFRLVDGTSTYANGYASQTFEALDRLIVKYIESRRDSRSRSFAIAAQVELRWLQSNRHGVQSESQVAFVNKVGLWLFDKLRGTQFDPTGYDRASLLRLIEWKFDSRKAAAMYFKNNWPADCKDEPLTASDFSRLSPNSRRQVGAGKIQAAFSLLGSERIPLHDKREFLLIDESGIESSVNDLDKVTNRHDLLMLGSHPSFARVLALANEQQFCLGFQAKHRPEPKVTIDDLKDADEVALCYS